MKIIADSAIPFLQGLFEAWGEVVYLPGADISAEQIRDADALVVRTRTRCNKALLDGSRVHLVVTATIGYDHIDTGWCAAHGIEVTTAAGCNARGVLQWIAAALVFLAQKQRWHPATKTLGVVGVGHVGSLIKTYAEAWGFRVICCDPPREKREQCGFLPIEELIQQADILTLHTPLDATTYHLVNAPLLTQMKQGAILINTSRGEVVDNAALAASPHPCLLDVWEQEPHLNARLLTKALLATPHIAGYSEQGKATATALAVDAIARHFDLPLRGWYPPQAAASTPRPIAWQELCTSIGGAFDIAAESRLLKGHPEAFESMRDNYSLRREYF